MKCWTESRSFGMAWRHSEKVVTTEKDPEGKIRTFPRHLVQIARLTREEERTFPSLVSSE
jgi:hypothetical protein